MQKRLILMMLFCYTILTGASFIRPLVIQKIIDDGLVIKNIHIVLIFAILLLVLAIIEGGIKILQAKIFVDLKNKLVLGLYTKLFYRLLHVEMTFFAKNNSAEIINKMRTDIDNVSILVDSNFMSMLNYVLQILSGIVGLFFIDWKLGFLVMAFVPIKFFLICIFSKKREAVVENKIKKSTAFCSWLGDMISGVCEIKLWNLYKNKTQELRRRQKLVLQEDKRDELLEAYNSTSDSLLEWIVISALYGIGGYFVCVERLSIGGLTAFISYSNYVVGPITLLFNIKFLLAKIRPSIHRIKTLLRVKTEQNSNTITYAPTFQKEIRFDKVTFSYGEQVVLNGLNFCIHKGEKIAIVGDNGCGKSTLVQLILRFLNPESGCIYIDGIDIAKCDLDQYRNFFSVVNQDVYLFSDTLENNITLGKKLDNSFLDSICKKMNLKKFKNKNLIKCDRELEGNGANLSGGERQKIALVRAVIKDAPILILDEATASIDSKYSEFLQNILMQDFKDKTMIIVTHKKEYLEGIDRVFHMK